MKVVSKNAPKLLKCILVAIDLSLVSVNEVCCLLWLENEFVPEKLSFFFWVTLAVLMLSFNISCCFLQILICFYP